MIRRLSIVISVIVGAFVLSAWPPPGLQPVAVAAADAPKIGVLLVNHGSKIKIWRDRLVAMEAGIKDDILAMPNIEGVKTAFNEYTEPSVSSRMKEFDDEGYDEVIVVPLFMSATNQHVFDDVAVGVGIKNDSTVQEELPKHGVAVYRPRTRATMLQSIDESGFLKDNIKRRVASLLGDGDPSKYGVTLGAYGSAPNNQQWQTMMANLGNHVTETLGIDAVNYAWSGHVVNYSMEPTRKAINQLLAEKEKVIVVSVYLSYDPQFLRDSIGEAGRQSDRPQDVLYNETESILPDPALSAWVTQQIAGALSVGRLARVIEAGSSSPN